MCIRDRFCNHVQQLFVACVGTEPAAVSPAVSVDWGKQPAFLTELVGVNLGHAVLGNQTDLLHAVQTRKAFGFILSDADIDVYKRQDIALISEASLLIHRNVASIAFIVDVVCQRTEILFGVNTGCLLYTSRCV